MGDHPASSPADQAAVRAQVERARRAVEEARNLSEAARRLRQLRTQAARRLETDDD